MNRLLGLGAYGRSFKLADPNNNGYRAPCTAGWTGLYSGSAGTYTREGGYLAYYEICEKLRNGWTEVWLEEGKVPYHMGHMLMETATGLDMTMLNL